MAKQVASTETEGADDYELPACPMCASTSWEQVGWSPFGRTGIFSDL